MKGKNLNRKAWRITIALVVILVAIFAIINDDSGLVENINAELDEFLFGRDNLVTSIENPILEVDFIDIGQGEAILIRGKDVNILVDTGESYQSSQLIRHIRSKNIGEIDLMILTHPHSDHIGGAVDILDNFVVTEVAMPIIPDDLIPSGQNFSALLESLSARNMSITDLWSGTAYEFASFTLTLLGPLESPSNLNDLSAIIKVEAGDISYLLTGDAEALAEKSLVNSELNLSADILNVAHHGSKTSTSEGFLDAVAPDIAIISCGIDNSYGHPHKEVLKLFNDRGIEVYRTDQMGTIVVATDGKNVSVVYEEELA